MKIKYNSFIKTLIFSCIMIFVTSNHMSSVEATDTNKYLKVGLTRDLSNKSQITINNSNINVGYTYENNSKLPLNITGSSIVAKPITSNFVKLSDTVSTQEEIKALQSTYLSQGIPTVIYMPSNTEFSLLVGPFESAQLAQMRSTELSSQNIVSSTIVVSSKIALVVNGSYAVVFGNDSLKPQATTYGTGEYISISDNLKYRGAIEFSIKGSYVQPVSVTFVEQYLYGVVPSEMPSSWHAEALKAQAVAARTYTLGALKNSKHTADGYQLCDSTHCQVYKGVNNESASANAAVDGTTGVAAYYNGVLIEALFSAANGGSIANSEDVWANSIPYLRAKADPYENGVLKWTREFTQAELTSLVFAQNPNLGLVQNVIIDKTDAYGRAVSMTFVCTNGTYKVEKDKIRSFFSSTSEGSLKSTNFRISQNLATTGTTTGNSIDDLTIYNNGSVIDYTTGMSVVQNNGTTSTTGKEVYVVDGNGKVVKYSENTAVVGGKLVLSGAGWGHGVGMSQWGAKGMADSGSTYQQILNFYYTNIELK